MDDYKVLDDGRRVYNLDGVRSRQTGTNAETVMIIGAKNAGKTFNVRLLCIDEYIASGRRFVEVSRSRDEMEDVAAGYFDRIQAEGLYQDWQFKTDSRCGYIAPKCDDGEKPDWEVICYFVSLSLFQRAKRRSNYVNVCNAIFDEFIIDARDRYHSYLPDEVGIFLNMLNSTFRPFPDDGIIRHVWMMANACDLTCPYLRHYGIDRPPEFGYTFYNSKTVLLHYVTPWDAAEARAKTIVGRMMAGLDDGQIFDNAFDFTEDKDVKKKSSAAKYAFALVFQKMRIGIWADYDAAVWYVTERIPDNAPNVYALTKRDGTMNYGVIQKGSRLIKMLSEIFYARGLRYESYRVREAFFTILDYLGIK